MSESQGSMLPPMPRIGDEAPSFTATTTVGDLTFADWAAGSWVLMFSHPADFTPVCSTELVEFARREEEFARRGAKLIGLSVDSIHAHLAWQRNLHEKLGVEITYPLIADPRGEVARLYGMLHPNESSTVTVRALFVIDPNRVVRAVIYYPLNVGRNVAEVLRVLDGLQTADMHGVAVPANWQPGQPVIVPPPRTLEQVAQRDADAYEERVDFYLVKRSL